MKIKFFFDYLSPYAFFAWKKLPEFKQRLNLQIEYYPILFAGLLNHWGQKGPAEIPVKSHYVFTQCLRYATKNNIIFTRPLYHPFNPVNSLRLSLIEVSGKNQHSVIDEIWKAGWEQGKDISNKDILVEIINKLDLSASELFEKIENPAIKEKLKHNTADAIKLGIFGVPTFITEDGTLFWGLDSMGDLEDYITGKESLDKDKLEEILNRESSALRK